MGGFWTAFESAVHQNTHMSAPQKFSYLLGRLKGPALNLVSGYSLTDVNYETVIRVLCERYGDKDLLSDKLQTELLNISKPHNTASSLRTFYDQIECICRQLSGLGMDVDANSFITIAIKGKIPLELQTQMLGKEMDDGVKWTAKQWREALGRAVRLKEAVAAVAEHSPAPSKSTPPARPPGTQEPIRRAFPVVNEESAPVFSDPNTCYLCGGTNHKPSRCPEYPTPDARKERLTAQRRCYICAREGHFSNSCPSKRNCPSCNGRHHFILCTAPKNRDSAASGANGVPLGPRRPSQVSNPVRTDATEPEPDGPTFQPTTPLICGPVRGSGDRDGKRPAAYLMVAEVEVFNHRDPENTARVPIFFDTGSQPSFITLNLASVLCPPRIAKEEMNVGGFMGRAVRLVSPRYSVLLKRQDGGWEPVVLNQTPTIIPPIEFLVGNDKADGLQRHSGAPQILLGIRDFWRFVLNCAETRPGLYRIDTVFGSVFGGETQISEPTPNVISGPIVSCPLTAARNPRSDDLAPLVRQLWDLQTLGIREEELGHETAAIDAFNDSIEYCEGRYYVEWPWKPGCPQIADNFGLAYSRLNSLLNRLKVDHKLRESYKENVAELLSQGIIEPTKRVGVGEYFMPHHPVITEKKVRIVYDASSHARGCLSLNDGLLPGPKLGPDLAALILRFRTSILPVLGDIAKAFLQVGLKEASREMAKFLWVKDLAHPLSPDNIQVFRFTRVAFGVTSSPFILASTLQYHLKNYPSIRSNFYVDNLLLDCKDPIDARGKIEEAKEIMVKAGMTLREFVSSDPRALEGLSENELFPGINSGSVKVLGVEWRLLSDELVLTTPPLTTGYTRRIILSTIASFFDPLGLGSPILFKLKCFFQELWEREKGWDDELDQKDRERWDELMGPFVGQKIVIPRRTPGQGINRLVAFTDAGPEGYAAVVYLVNSSVPAVSRITFAKSRLRPRKLEGELTIPKLELLGITVGVKCLEFVRAALDLPIETLHLFSDSQIALSWIGKVSSTLPIFVANRVQKIREYSTVKFHYVPREFNPADFGVRGATAVELMGADLWWSGPGWLSESLDNWPAVWPMHQIPDEISNPIVDPPQPPMLVNPTEYSNWRSLLAVTRFSLCFIAKTGGEVIRRRMPWLAVLSNMSEFGPEANRVASNYIIKSIQSGLEDEDLAHTHQDGNGLICLSTRLTHADRPVEFRNPVVLPRDNWVTRLLILEAHQQMFHVGIEGTLCRFLSNYYCRRARRLVKKIIQECEVCRRDRALRYRLPAMPPWPRPRVNPTLPFEFVGLDYLGPTIYKRPVPEPGKAWILLFTCFSTRAVHLELVENLETITFILALRRFIARRGTPREILSDNAAQLILAREVLMRFNDIRWKLTPPLAPWGGGLYERLNRLIKAAFRRALGRKILPWPQLVTFTTEVEATLNNRPITFVSDDPAGPHALRPMDFLLPRANPILMEPLEGEDPNYRPTAAERMASLWFSTARALQEFWKTWSRDYLLLLRQRLSTSHPTPRSVSNETPHVGHIVLVEMEDLSRNLWPLGRIIALDEHRRTARVQMADKVLVRPVCKLIPLEAMIEGENLPEGGGVPLNPPTDEESGTPPHTPMADADGGLAGRLADDEEPAASDTNELEGREELSPPIPFDEGDAPRSAPRFRWASHPPSYFGSGSGPAPQEGTSAETPSAHHSPFSRWASSPPSQGRPSTSAGIFLLPMSMNFTYLFIFSLLLTFSASFSESSDLPLKCTDSGVSVDLAPGASNNSLCCEGICDTRPYREPYSFPLPADLLTIGYECQISYSMRAGKYEYKIECAHKDGCFLIDCFFCLERWFNPQCYPIWFATTLGILIVLLGFLFYIFSGFIVTFFNFYRTGRLGLWWYRWRHPTRPNSPRVHWHRPRRIFVPGSRSKDEGEVTIALGSPEETAPVTLALRPSSPLATMEEDDDEMLFPMPTHTSSSQGGLRLRGLTRVGSALGLQILLFVFFLTFIPIAWATITLSAKTEHCYTQSNGTVCDFNSVTSFHLPPGKSVHFSLRGPHNLAMGQLYITLGRGLLTCQRELISGTRPALFESDTVVRCHGAGSCHSGICARLPLDSSIPELSLHSDFPGNTYCSEVNGWWPNGCFFPHKACLFYRIFARPLSHVFYELVSCPTWTYHLSAKLVLERAHESPIRETVILVPGSTQHIGGMNLSLDPVPMGHPPLPILGTKFLMNISHAVLVPSEFTSLISCATELTPVHQCRVDLSACRECSEYPEDGKLNCTCQGYDLDRLWLSRQQALPLQLPNLEIFQVGASLGASVSLSTHLMMEMINTRLVVQDTRAVCRIQHALLNGCYNCRTGGRVSFVCRSSFGQVEAVITCTDHSYWTAICSPKGVSGKVILSWTKPVVKTICSVDCGEEHTTFELNGTLIFLSRSPVSVSVLRQNSVFIAPEGFHWPPLDFLFSAGLGSLHQQLLAFLAGAGTMALLYLFLKCTGLGLALSANLYAPGRPLPRARLIPPGRRIQTM